MDSEIRNSGVATILVIPLAQYLVGIVLFIALVKGERDVILLCLFAFGIVFGARLWSQKSASRLTCRLTLEKRRVFPGDRVGLDLNAENAKFLPVWLQVGLSVDNNIRQADPDAPLTRDCSLLWFQRACFHWDFSAQTRGVCQIGASGVKVGDPFGFFPRIQPNDDTLQLIVYPRLIPLKACALPRRDFFGVPGAESPVQDPVYMLGTRDYQHRQPAKHIHWKASARYNQLQEKVFEPTAQEKVLFLIDVENSSDGPEEECFERSLEVAASLAVRLDREGYAVGLMTNGTLQTGGTPITPVSRRPQQLSAILEVLAKVQPKVRENLLDTLRRRPIMGAGISCLHFSCQESATTLKIGEYLRNRKIPMQCIFARTASDDSKTVQTPWKKIYYLEDIVA